MGIDCFLSKNVAGQFVLSKSDLAGHLANLEGHCPLTGRYFEPWTVSTQKQSLCEFQKKELQSKMLVLAARTPREKHQLSFCRYSTGTKSLSHTH